jgi:hypothetical protein
VVCLVLCKIFAVLNDNISADARGDLPRLSSWLLSPINFGLKKRFLDIASDSEKVKRFIEAILSSVVLPSITQSPKAKVRVLLRRGSPLRRASDCSLTTARSVFVGAYKAIEVFVSRPGATELEICRLAARNRAVVINHIHNIYACLSLIKSRLTDTQKIEYEKLFGGLEKKVFNTISIIRSFQLNDFAISSVPEKRFIASAREVTILQSLSSASSKTLEVRGARLVAKLDREKMGEILRGLCFEDPESVSVQLFSDLKGLREKNQAALLAINVLDVELGKNPGLFQAAVTDVMIMGLGKLQGRMRDKMHHTYLHGLKMATDCTRDFKMFGDRIAIANPEVSRVMYLLLPVMAFYHDIVQEFKPGPNEDLSAKEFVADFTDALKTRGVRVDILDEVAKGVDQIAYRVIKLGTHFRELKKIDAEFFKELLKITDTSDACSFLNIAAGILSINDTRSAANLFVQQTSAQHMLESSEAVLMSAPVFNVLRPLNMGKACAVIGQMARMIYELGFLFKSDETQDDRSVYRATIEHFSETNEILDVHLRLKNPGEEPTLVPVWVWLPVMICRDRTFHLDVDTNTHKILTGELIKYIQQDAWGFFNRFFADLTSLVDKYRKFLKSRNQKKVAYAKDKLEKLTTVILIAANMVPATIPTKANPGQWVGVDLSKQNPQDIIDGLVSYSFMKIGSYS